MKRLSLYRGLRLAIVAIIFSGAASGQVDPTKPAVSLALQNPSSNQTNDALMLHEVAKQTPVTKAIEDEHFIFDFATDFYYKNNVSDLENFSFSDKDFNTFKAYLKTNNFSFETETEKALNTALLVAEEEKLDETIASEYKDVISALNSYKNASIDKNKAKLSGLLKDEIIKRYFYAEGLYDYYKTNNTEILKALDILNDTTKYSEILN